MFSFVCVASYMINRHVFLAGFFLPYVAVSRKFLCSIVSVSVFLSGKSWTPFVPLGGIIDRGPKCTKIDRFSRASAPGLLSQPHACKTLSSNLHICSLEKKFDVVYDAATASGGGEDYKEISMKLLKNDGQRHGQVNSTLCMVSSSESGPPPPYYYI